MPAIVSNRFLNRLHDEQLPAGRATLTSPLHYCVSPFEVIVVPRGFETDYASVPALSRFGIIFALLFQFLSRWWIVFYLPEAFCFWVCFVAEWLENRDSDAAAVVHDYLYRIQDRPRWKCDLILFHAMAAQGAPFNPLWKRILFLINVRLFGWIAWRQDGR